jgi:hypothetical protein
VVFTDFEATRLALQTANHLARDLNARVLLLVAKIVPYPLPLEAPPVSTDFTDRVVSQLAAEQDSEIRVKVYLCRDRDETIRGMLSTSSIVVLGTSKSWWPVPPRLARLLKRDGHQVIVARAARNLAKRADTVHVESSPLTK